MRIPSPSRLLAFSAIALAGVVSIGGGGTYLAMEITTKPKFCNSCHIMEPYYESWATSSHKDVACVDCHYEPGLLETFEGKFKALSQLAKYVTGTEGTKPWAEVSDYSCMRSGCHSERLLEGEIQFGRIRFDHRHHLIGLRRGKKLRCTSCHSQVVQGDHLTVTTSSCFLCHFRQGEGSEPIDDCNTCHGPPADEIELGGFVFRHSDYLGRGVKCKDCHGDVTRGEGSVPRQRCGSCHNKQEHLERYEEVEFLHSHHVAEHSVSCLECHTEVQHSLIPREEHYQGDCRDCHVGSHGAPTGLYRGTGGRDVEDNPSVMYLARVTCNGCHKPPFPGAPTPLGGATFKADPLACIECHGPGYKGMAGRWQAEVRETSGKLRESLEELHALLGEEWEEGDVEAARLAYDAAAHNLGLVLLDASQGVHNLPYVRDLMRKADEDLRAGYRALDPGEEPRPVPVGPSAASKQGCTQLCHTGIETQPIERARELPFPHGRHILKAGFDCAKCHKPEPHGTTFLRQADCVSCHHDADDPEHCGGCHTGQVSLWNRETEGEAEPEMRDLDCLTCHEVIADGHSREAIVEACDSCHEDAEEGYVEAWIEKGEAPLREVEERLAGLPADRFPEIRAALADLKRARPFHNGAYVREWADGALAEMGEE